MRYFMLLCVVLAGCSGSVQLSVNSKPVYIDESKVPAAKGVGDKSGTEVLGEKYPHIIIAGNELDYNPIEKWYYFAGSDVKACWLEFGGSETEAPTRMLGQTTRAGKNDKQDVFDPKTKKWVPSDLSTPPDPPEIDIEVPADNI